MRDRSSRRLALAGAIALALAAGACRRRASDRTPGDDELGGPVHGSSESVGELASPNADVVEFATLGSNHLYPAGRHPLVAPRLRRLPPGSIRPRGWIAARVESFAAGAGDLSAARKVRMTPLVVDRSDEDTAAKALVREAEVAVDGASKRAALLALARYYELSADASAYAAIESHVRGLAARAAAEPPARALADDLELAIWLYERSGDENVLELVGTLVSSKDDDETGGEVGDDVDRLRLELLRRRAGAPSSVSALARELELVDATLIDALGDAEGVFPGEGFAAALERVAFNTLPSSRGSESGAAWCALVETLWRASPGDGLAAVSYAACEVVASVGEDEGTVVRLRVDSDYPVGESVTIVLNAPRAARFPLAFRIPLWCRGASARVNDGAPIPGAAGGYLTLLREWGDGDRVVLRLPRTIGLSSGPRNSVGVELGPLRFRAASGRERSAIVLDRFAPGQSITVEYARAFLDPFDPDDPAVKLRARGRALESSTSEAGLPQSPVLGSRLESDDFDLVLVPVGAGESPAPTLPWTAP